MHGQPHIKITICVITVHTAKTVSIIRRVIVRDATCVPKWDNSGIYVARQLSLWTCHCVLAVAAMDKSLSMVWWQWHISVSQLCCHWSMEVSFWVASITVCVCFGVPPRECQSLNYSSEQTLNFLLNLERVEMKWEMLVQWLFSVPEDKENIERKAFWWHWWHQEQYNSSSEGHSTKPVPKLFWRVE